MGYIGQAPANKAVKTADIEDSAITAAKIADGTVVAGELASDSVTTAKILNANVTEAKIADDAITLAKMASGTDGNIISYDASGNPVAISTGNDGQVLTSAGAGQPPAFEAVSGGAADNYFASSGLSNKDLGTGLHIKIADSGADVDSGGGQLIIENDDNAGLSVLTNTAGTAMINFGDSGDNNIGRILYDHGNNYMELVTNGSGQARFLSNGDVNVRVGDIFFETAGKGIVLGATSNTAANTLDHYEEGTWTPTLPSGGTVGTVNGSKYTRIGNICHCFVNFNTSSIPDNGTYFRVGGLPFTSAAAAAYGGGGCNYAQGGGYDWSDAGFNTSLNATETYFHKINNSTGTVNNNDVNGMVVWAGHIWYHTA